MPQKHEIADEQPSAWFRVRVESTKLVVHLSNCSDDDGSVLVTCDDREAAADDRTIE